MQKGGVGKTTTAVNLGAALAEQGQRVLLIDLDAQGHLTLYMKPAGELEKTIYHLLVDPETTVTDVVQEARQMGVHYIPADIELAGAENQLINEIGRESILRDKLEPAKGRYDFIIIDCPPSLDLIVINALVAADEVLVPLQAEFLALQRMQELLVTMERVKRRLNPRLELNGILPTLYKHRALPSQEVLPAVNEKYGPQVITDTDDVIRDAVDRPSAVKEVVLKTLNFTPEEIELLLEAVQTAKYPDRPRAKPPLDKFDSLDALRLKIQAVLDQ